jgi:hypothetical protein
VDAAGDVAGLDDVAGGAGQVRASSPAFGTVAGPRVPSRTFSPAFSPTQDSDSHANPVTKQGLDLQLTSPGRIPGLGGNGQWHDESGPANPLMLGGLVRGDLAVEDVPQNAAAGPRQAHSGSARTCWSIRAVTSGVVSSRGGARLAPAAGSREADAVDPSSHVLCSLYPMPATVTTHCYLDCLWATPHVPTPTSTSKRVGSCSRLSKPSTRPIWRLYLTIWPAGNKRCSPNSPPPGTTAAGCVSTTSWGCSAMSHERTFSQHRPLEGCVVSAAIYDRCVCTSWTLGQRRSTSTRVCLLAEMSLHCLMIEAS